RTLAQAGRGGRLGAPPVFGEASAFRVPADRTRPRPVSGTRRPDGMGGSARGEPRGATGHPSSFGLWTGLHAAHGVLRVWRVHRSTRHAAKTRSGRSFS